MEQYERSILLIGEILHDSKCETIYYKCADPSQITLKKWYSSPVNETKFSSESFQSDSIVYLNDKMERGN